MANDTLKTTSTTAPAPQPEGVQVKRAWEAKRKERANA
jgi:hypothetical protein